MASGETYVQYGSLLLFNCLTLPGGFQQTAVMDDSNTDLLYYRFTIGVVGWITNINQTNAVIGSQPFTATSAGANRVGMSYTIAPRQHFEYHTGAQVNGFGNVLTPGVPVIVCDPIFFQGQIGSSLTNLDLNNGPKCTHFNVTQVTSDNLFRVEAEFEICMLMCDQFGQASNSSGILNNRWTMTDVFDRDRMTTRTISGKLRLATSVINPNAFRNVVIPSLQPGMTRESVEMSVTPDALNLMYSITDKEIAYSAPAPATSWTFEHTESATREGALSKYGEVRVSLSGDRYVDHKKLIALAVSIAEAKLTKGASNKQCYIMENTITDRYGDGENGVSLICRGRRFPKDGQALLGLPTSILGIPIAAADIAEVAAGYDPTLSRGARVGDAIEVSGPISLVAAFSSYLQSPCNGNHLVSQVAPSSTPGTPSPTPPTSVSATIVQSIPDDQTNSYFNTAGNSAIYTYYHMQSAYETASMRVHAPIAIVGSGGSSSSPYAASGSQQTSVVGNLGPRLTKRRIRLKAERLGQWPDMPQLSDGYTDSNGISYAILDVIDISLEPDYSVDAKKIYTTEREYVFALSRAPNSTDSVAIGVNPFDNSPLVVRAYDPGYAETNYPIS